MLYYCRKYGDIAESGMDPLLHYIWYGGYEGRNPSESFDSAKYLAAYEDVKKSGVNPFAHYVVFGKDEGRKAIGVNLPKKNTAVRPEKNVKPIEKSKTVNSPKTLKNNESSVAINDHQSEFSYREFGYTFFSKRLKALKEKVITIIVPVYNAYEETAECIEYVLKNTDFPYRLMLINDCSTDERISPLLDKYKQNENVTVIENEENFGFVRTVNYGITHSENDVVFLNSDTKVTKGWLRKLAVAAYHKGNIATVTPFSNAAGAFSVPVMGENKDIPAEFDLETMSSVTERCSKLDYVDVPTGNGFCMYVTRKAIDSVGILDYEAFSRGYGEENDFCMRAKNAGFINIIADDTYIYHKRSASFKDEKQKLITENRKILDARYPEYSSEITKFSVSPELIANRNRIKDIVDNKQSAPFLRKRLLYVLHEGTGGTVKTNEDLMHFAEKNNYEVFMLTSNTSQMKLYSESDGSLNLLHTWKLETKWDISNFYVPEYADIYFDVLCNLHIELVHIRHLFKHSFDIVDIADVLRIPVILSFHDFYFICPSINLVNSDKKYCNAECRECDEKCVTPSVYVKVRYPLNEWTKEIWRAELSKLYTKIKAFVTTSEYTKKTYLKIYPELSDRFYVIEHGRNFDYDRHYRGGIPSEDKIVILLPGNINMNKGGDYINKLIDIDKEKKLEFHCMGALSTELPKEFKDKIIYHGKYVREDFVRLVNEIAPAYIGIFSIWPETYCHVLTEAWSCGVPCIVSDIGTLKERADAQGGCIKADLDDVEKTYKEIIDISFSEKYFELCEQVQKADIHSIERMGTEYLALYDKIINKCFLNDIERGTMIWVNNYIRTGEYHGSSYIRVVSPIMNNPVIRRNLTVAEARHASDIPFESEVVSYIIVLVQREKIDNDSVLLLQEKVKEYPSLKIIFEIDDNLISINENHPHYSMYENNINKIRSISKIASKIITTSEVISKGLNTSVAVIPNYIDNRLWNITDKNTVFSKKKFVKILYFGTSSHCRDLAILKEPIEMLNNRLKNEDIRAVLVVVGCSNEQEDWFDVLKVPNDSKTYPEFVKWLKEVNDFDIGVAPLDLSIDLNYAKSPLKYFEYAALGLPCVCTAIKPYNEAVINGQTGFLIKDNAADEWADAIYQLVMSAELREKIVSNAKSDIEKNHMLSDHYSEIADIFLNMEEKS
ncbi:MAG: glycosyltransferase [Ruminococcus sp.]|nr:glycosyltransferase [Ruminococcus sp.]